MKAVCLGVNGEGVKFGESDAARVAAALEKAEWEVELWQGQYGSFRLNMADVLYYAGPADHKQIGLVSVGYGLFPVSYLAMWFGGLILDTCKVGKLVRESGKTPVIAAAEEYAFEDARESTSVFAKLLVRWIEVRGTCDPADRELGQYLAGGVMGATGMQVVRQGWI